MFAESEIILVIFVPLHEQCQYNTTMGLGGWTDLYELAQISDVLKTEVLCKIQTVLLNRVYAARPIGGS